MIRRMWDVTLTVEELKRAIDFYENILGLQKKYEFEDYAGFDCGGVELGLKTWGELEKPRKGEPCINFLVDDIEESHKILQEKGVKIIRGPEETLWGSSVIVLADPDENVLQLTQVEWEGYFEASAPTRSKTRRE